ncbi:MAG: acetolactate synthase small subunit [Candidatus Omnitrophota bacterium]
MKHILSVLVENKPGVLARISGLFSARAYNIDSLAVGETEDPKTSRMTIVVDAADARILEQILKQLNRLIDTISVIDLTRKEHVERQLLIVKVAFSPAKKKTIAALVKKYGAEIISTKKDSCVIELCDHSNKVREFLGHIGEFGIKELSRTGRVVVSL